MPCEHESENEHALLVRIRIQHDQIGSPGFRSRDRAVEPEQWLQRHPEAGWSWPSWPEASWHQIVVLNGHDSYRTPLRYESSFGIKSTLCEINAPYTSAANTCCSLEHRGRVQHHLHHLHLFGIEGCGCRVYRLTILLIEEKTLYIYGTIL